MGLLDTLTAALGGGTAGGAPGGQQQVQQIAAGQGDFADPASPDHAGLAAMVQHAPPGALSQIFSQVAGGMGQQQYAAHINPPGGGPGPMGGLESAALSMVATTLIAKLTGGGGYTQSSLLSAIPGLGTANPAQMNAQQVAQVAQYTQQNHPDLFGQAAAQVAQQQPGVLGALMGHAGMAQGAMALASHFLQNR